MGKEERKWMWTAVFCAYVWLAGLTYVNYTFLKEGVAWVENMNGQLGQMTNTLEAIAKKYRVNHPKS